jgi:hypothetical protein
MMRSENQAIPGVRIPQILLPEKGIDLRKWAVIACDQFTSQPDYWQRVREYVGSSPSTYNLILPEVFLGTPEEPAHIQQIKDAMRAILESGLLTRHDGPIYVERTVDHRTRRGLMLCLDLEEYNYNPGSQTLIRATEGTILERLPPRIRIREGAALELPHIIVLIDDPQRTVIEPLSKVKGSLPVLYDFDLMEDSGHLTSFSAAGPEPESSILKALSALSAPQNFHARYGTGPDKSVLLFAIGDGNHSLATAKVIWEKLKPQVGLEHPARFALVEIENLHDEGLEFKPIHRVLFGVKQDWFSAMAEFFNGRLKRWACTDENRMVVLVDQNQGKNHLVGVNSSEGYSVIEVSDPTSNLPVGTLQGFLDDFLSKGGATKIDYVHGEDVLSRLGRQPGNLGFYLPAMQKSDLFKTVILDGVLPRKTFSMGEAREKRFYMECRRIA